MHHESHDLVVVVEVGRSEFDIDIHNHWINITIFIQHQISLEVDIEVLENELNSALAWQNQRIDLLHRIDFPFFDGREIEFNQRDVESAGEL
jgi:hypothetical protein